MLSADVEVSGTNVARVFFHYTDPNNAYFIELDTTAAAVKLIEIVNGASSAITTGAYTTGASVPGVGRGRRPIAGSQPAASARGSARSRGRA
jgi:hypothetical protein